MPLRFNKAERDEWLAKSHTCAACCAGDCKDCSGNCDCSDCGGKSKGASVLDALESRTANIHIADIPSGNELCPRCKGQGCGDCRGTGTVPSPEQKMRTEWSPEQVGVSSPKRRMAGVLEEPAQANPDLLVPPTQSDPVKAPCPHCGASLAPFVLEHRLNCPHCGNPANSKTAEASMPPEGTSIPQKETALPYNPGAYEGMVQDLHPAAQYTYERAVQQGAPPQAAMAAAQEKQGEMMKRTQEGQNIEGIQIPVVGHRISDLSELHRDLAALPGPNQTICKDCGKPMNPVEAMVSQTHGVCGDCTRRKQKEVTGFVSARTIKRVSHLIST